MRFKLSLRSGNTHVRPRIIALKQPPYQCVIRYGGIRRRCPEPGKSGQPLDAGWPSAEPLYYSVSWAFPLV